MRYRIRHWFARLLCKHSWHRFERRGSWSRCIRVHRTLSEAVVANIRYLCYEHEISSAYDHGAGRMWLRDGDQ